MSDEPKFYPEYNMFLDPDDLEVEAGHEDEVLHAWPGKHPVNRWSGYPHKASRRAQDVFIMIYALVSHAHLDSWPVWLYQGHEGCSSHWTSPDRTLCVCNATDGSLGAADGHPNLTVTLPDGRTIEATWDELANKPHRTTVSCDIDDETAEAMLRHAAQTVRGDVAKVLADPDLGLCEHTWVANILT